MAEGGQFAIYVNLYGNLRGCDLAQILYRKGLLDRTMQSFLARHGL